MKILNRWTTGQNSSASARLSKFKIKVSELFWENCSLETLNAAKNKDNFFAINRAIFESFDKYVGFFEVSHVFCRESVNRLQNKTDDYAVEYLSRSLADHIAKHNFIPLTIDENAVSGDVEYKLSVAFFIMPNEENKSLSPPQDRIR